MPKVDDHLVVPETTRDELVRGRKVIAQPAAPPHADRHAQVNYVIRAHAAPGYVASSDLLTRVGPGSDFATDTSVRREGIDPETGSRYLEELAFEVVSTQSMRDITERAEDLTNRGVRRMIAIFVKDGTVRELSRERQDWLTFPADGVLDDPTLVRPVAIRALLDAVAADNAVVDALERKANPRLAEFGARQREEGLDRGLEAGRKEGLEAGRKAGLEAGRKAGLEAGRKAGLEAGRKAGLERTLEVACELLGISIGPSERARIEPLDAAALEALLARLKSERAWPND